MGEKRLDFDAPLISVRRIAAKTEPRAKTVANPGVIPFRWEQSPGKPKGSPSSRLSSASKLPTEADEDELLSCNDSSLDCSVSDCSWSSGTDDGSKDPEVRDFMIGRFLPAAKAMATGPLQTSALKEPRQIEKAADGIYRRSPVPLPYQHRAKEAERYGDEDDEEANYWDSSDFPRSCGLIPRLCMKSSFLMLNPVPWMKVRSQLPARSSLNDSDHGSSGQASDEVKLTTNIVFIFLHIAYAHTFCCFVS